jgi:acetyl esterase/lipase
VFTALLSNSVAGAATTLHRTETNLLYRTGELTDAMRERCRLDVHFPVGGSNLVTVIWWHGGSLTGGNREIPRALQNQGLIVVAPSYRLSPQVKAPAYIEDAAAAVAWTYAHLARYGGSERLVFLSGHSAGGYLATMVGLDRRWLAPYGLDPNRLAGLVPFSPQAITHFTIRAERGIPNTTPVIDEYAPIHFVRKDAPPLLLITGDRELELLGRYEENAYFWRMMQLVGHPDTHLHELGGFSHGKWPNRRSPCCCGSFNPTAAPLPASRRHVSADHRSLIPSALPHKTPTPFQA